MTREEEIKLMRKGRKRKVVPKTWYSGPPPLPPGATATAVYLSPQQRKFLIKHWGNYSKGVRALIDAAQSVQEQNKREKEALVA